MGDRLTSGDEPLVRARGLRKEFPGQVALHGLDLDLMPGRVHALVGSNGSGKSTFIKMLAGAYSIDAGTLEVIGQREARMSPARAYVLGLRFLHQKPTVFPALTVAENIGLACRFVTSGRMRTNRRAEEANAEAALDFIGFRLDPRRAVGTLSPVGRTMVAVAAALQHPEGAPRPRVLVLDEPTAALPEHEVELVFDLVRAVTLNGISVLYVSHRLPEVVELADHVTVLRDGARVHHSAAADLDHGGLVRHIVGEEQPRPGTPVRGTPVHGTPAPAAEPDRPALDVRGVETARLSDVTIRLNAGEIVGIAGLLGTGRSELLNVLAGARAPRAGRWSVRGRSVRPGDIRDARRAGLAHVPEDRAGQALFPGLPASANLLLPDLKKITRRGRVHRGREAAEAARLMDAHDVNPRAPMQSIATFSGGNQQKAVIARWLRLDPAVLLVDEPTQAVDVKAKSQIHEAIRRYAAGGGAALVVSSDFDELAALCHRVHVIRGRSLDLQLSGPRLSAQALLDAVSWEPAHDDEHPPSATVRGAFGA
ncbi:sugar ABC transporter ATP-binding protein [Actinomadura formosensis]|uniref:sugar ABC transporter ATP-binding protein n=1 Tax=Actinomadura formosensis TaxID=60706 RepID=UPI001041886A|nr:sugar ABC transporter ATP-binding protein [Actinomadura formosensis]